MATDQTTLTLLIQTQVKFIILMLMTKTDSANLIG